MLLPVEMQARDSKLETEPKAQHDLGCRLCFQHVIVKDSEHMQNYYRHAKHATHTRMVTHVADDGALRPLLDGVKGIWASTVVASGSSGYSWCSASPGRKAPR